MPRVNVLEAFKQGVSALGAHIYLVFFPLALDLFLLFGPRFTVGKMVQPLISMLTLPANSTQSLQESFAQATQLLREFFTYYSLTSFLRTLPLGIPSLFAARPFETSPAGASNAIEIGNLAAAIGIGLVFAILGFVFFLLFFESLTRAVQKQLNLSSESKNLAARSANLLFFQLASIAAFLMITIPGVFFVAFVTVFSPTVGSLGYIILAAFIISALLPFIFTPIAINLEGKRLVEASARSLHVYKRSGPQSSMMVFLFASIIYLTNLLWQSPADGSWMLLVGAGGHALVTTVLLLSSFFYYQQAKSFADAIDDVLLSKNDIPGSGDNLG